MPEPIRCDAMVCGAIMPEEFIKSCSCHLIVFCNAPSQDYTANLEARLRACGLAPASSRLASFASELQLHLARRVAAKLLLRARSILLTPAADTCPAVVLPLAASPFTAADTSDILGAPADVSAAEQNADAREGVSAGEASPATSSYAADNATLKQHSTVSDALTGTAARWLARPSSSPPLGIVPSIKYKL